MHLKGEGESKEPNGTTGYGSPSHGDGTSRDPYSSSHTGDRPDRSQDVPGAVRHQIILVGGLLFTLLTEVELAGAL